MFKYTEILTLLFVLILSAVALAAEDPDELYKQGRFTEAEKAYTQLDMDHPKDTRFRYNRACAAYQSSDYKGATAAFSSVLRRAKDNETRFKTAYNLGNTAFKQGDFATAVVYYKQAITYNPENKDAGYNLELALMQLEKQEKNKTKDQKKQSEEGSSQPQDKENKSKDSKEGKDSDERSNDKTSEQKASQGQDQQDKKDRSESEDLSGDLKPLQAMPEEENAEGDKNTGQAMSAIDRKKAESLLDNLKEDRSGFMRFQVPKDKRRGVQSGKDW
ncbi:MAG: tetratricopeptide repeat protein [Deltaproteobacteria bacterium]|nr:tetratricopeptide repeat protein [Deltaproteobacteria bacterium]MBW1718961.1 tetratricopeptide repeat protein [Deltaproteobacteria bacterium]MBW1931925.1 tetratricopeptide repeat protein [Deltaproteobacteria bacterium]MBW1937273.1 tetratricopeptide repeat protein [Deltaproteobacteria bacterium]MBW1963726.1 tetratricopeptide repeat protein [Deltaproteobacteria bacterium]